MQKHFAPPRENVGFEFVLDETGINVYAQWDGEVDVTMIPTLLNVALELRCLHPPIDQLIVIVVDANGKINLIGQTPAAPCARPTTPTTCRISLRFSIPNSVE
jgi:hypothetical protein